MKGIWLIFSGSLFPGEAVVIVCPHRWTLDQFLLHLWPSGTALSSDFTAAVRVMLTLLRHTGLGFYVTDPVWPRE